MQHPYISLLKILGQWVRRSVGTLWLVAAAAYLSVMAGRAVYSNYQSQQDTNTLEEQLVQVEMERERLKALIVYYKSPAYQEQELRRALLLKQPGEVVYALPEASQVRGPGEIEMPTGTGEAAKPVSELPGWRQWVQYVLRGRE